jgi:molybdate transport system ATP-binding protein
MLNISLDTHLNTFHLSVKFCTDIGKTTVLLGESGAGKTTVLRLLAGLLHPQRGHITLDGHVYYDSERRIVVPPRERPFGYVFQDYMLFPHLSVFENVAFGLRAQHLSRQLIRQRVSTILDQMRLTGLDQRLPSQLSGGQQQRVAIARALALQPQLLLLDEPLSALDVQTRREIRQELRHILNETGITTVLVTHHYLEALLFAHQILVLDHGSLIQQGGQRDLREAPRSTYVAELVGTNFFCGRIVGYETNTMCIIQLPTASLSDRAVEIVATLRERSITESVPDIGDEAYVVIAPHSITLHRTPPEGSARNIFCGEIIHILAEDGRMRISIQMDNAPAMTPLIAEITHASADRMELHEGLLIYATFKATEASAYI